MAPLIGGTLLVVLSLVYAAYRFSTRLAGHVATVAAFLWISSLALFWLSDRVYTNDETRREMGEWVAVMPIALAFPLSLLSLLLFVVGMNRQR